MFQQPIFSSPNPTNLPQYPCINPHQTQSIIYNISRRMQNQKIEQAQEQFIWTWTFIILAFIFASLCFKIKQARKRKQGHAHDSIYINRQKIIIAVEIIDFIVRYRQRAESGYLPLHVDEEDNVLVRAVKKVLRIGHYYRPTFSTTRIKQFIQGLAEMRKVELMLYSSIQPEIAEAILSKLQIDKYFPPEKRKFCDLENDDDQKHAIQVDQDSRRVIILTPSYEDHTYEDQKYFLVLRPKTEEPQFLKNTLRNIKTFVERNDDLNMLHEELGEYKVNVESDWSDYEI